MEQPYYYGQLGKDARAAYTAMLLCMEQLAPSARVPRLDDGTLSDVFARLKLDHPEIFYVKSYTYSYTEESDYVNLEPAYLFDKAKIRSQQKALETRAARLARQAEGGGEEEREAFIHRFIVENVRYDKLEKEYSHEVLGPLTTGVGVCEGIAKTVKLLCARLELPCIVAISEADPAHGVKYRHAWNLVKLPGGWYHFDATFDNTLSRGETERFDYFNLSDAQIFRDHLQPVYPLPACPDAGRFYYRARHLSFTKPEDAESRVRQALRKRQEQLVFHWRGGYLTRDVLERLLQDAARAAAERGRYAACSVNFPQAVVSLRFADAPSMVALREENAAEAEESN